MLSFDALDHCIHEIRTNRSPGNSKTENGKKKKGNGRRKSKSGGSQENKGRNQVEKILAANSSSTTHTAMCRPSGKAATHDTAPELMGFRSVFSSLGTPVTLTRPNCRVSQTSTLQLRRPAYTCPPSADQHACIAKRRPKKIVLKSVNVTVTFAHNTIAEKIRRPFVSKFIPKLRRNFARGGCTEKRK